MIKREKNGKNIKRIGPKLVESYSDKFKSKYKRNKQLLRRLVIISLSIFKNFTSSYINSLLKKIDRINNWEAFD